STHPNLPPTRFTAPPEAWLSVTSTFLPLCTLSDCRIFAPEALPSHLTWPYTTPHNGNIHNVAVPAYTATPPPPPPRSPPAAPPPIKRHTLSATALTNSPFQHRSSCTTKRSVVIPTPLRLQGTSTLHSNHNTPPNFQTQPPNGESHELPGPTASGCALQQPQPS